jgi:hypothetical protein
MNETENRGSLGEAIIVVAFLFLILTFFIYQYGSSKSQVTNDEIEKNPENTISNLPEDDENGTYNKYLKQIYDTQTGSNTSASVDQILESYQQELLYKTTIPNQNLVIKNVSLTLDRKEYGKSFESLYEAFKKNGGGTEGKILASQITKEKTLLTLSDYDKQVLSQIADEYDDFSAKLVEMETPKVFENRVLEIAVDSKNVAFILRKMVNETDINVYTLWISKYAQNMSAIITDRYGLQ